MFLFLKHREASICIFFWVHRAAWRRGPKGHVREANRAVQSVAELSLITGAIPALRAKLSFSKKG